MRYVRNLLRTTCEIFGGKEEFGFDPLEIGSKSVRSGAAMALFLADVSVAKIMILGRSSSDALLDSICPQVLEWTGSMSRDMTKMHNFIDVGLTRSHTPADPRARKQLQSFNGSSFLIPIRHLPLTQPLIGLNSKFQWLEPSPDGTDGMGIKPSKVFAWFSQTTLLLYSSYLGWLCALSDRGYSDGF